MIDILGIVIYVITTEKYSEEILTETHELFIQLCNSQNIQSDSYQIFSEIMKIGYLPLNYLACPIKKQPEKNILLLKCERSYHYYLKSLDPELYNFLESKNIQIEKYLRYFFIQSLDSKYFDL